MVATSSKLSDVVADPSNVMSNTNITKSHGGSDSGDIGTNHNNDTAASSSTMTSSSSNKVSSPISPLKAPRRPLSAYNFFFQDQRAKILGEQIVSQEEEHDTDACTGNKKRKHRKAHGKIGFTALAKHVGTAWKALNKDERKIYEQKFKDDKERYKREVVEYEEKLSSLIHLAQVKKALKTIRAQEAEKQAAVAASSEITDEDESGSSNNSNSNESSEDAEFNQIAAMTMPPGMAAATGLQQQQQQFSPQQVASGCGMMMNNNYYMMNGSSNMMTSNNNTMMMNHNQMNYYNNTMSNRCNSTNDFTSSNCYSNACPSSNSNNSGFNTGTTSSGAMMNGNSSNSRNMNSTGMRSWNPFANHFGGGGQGTINKSTGTGPSSFSSLLSQAIWFSRGSASSEFGGGNAITADPNTASSTMIADTTGSAGVRCVGNVQGPESQLSQQQQQKQRKNHGKVDNGTSASCPDHHAMLMGHNGSSSRYLKRRCSLDRTAVPTGLRASSNMGDSNGTLNFPEYHDVMPSIYNNNGNGPDAGVAAEQVTSSSSMLPMAFSTGATGSNDATGRPNSGRRGSGQQREGRRGSSSGTRTTRRCSAPSAACFTAARNFTKADFSDDEDDEPTPTKNALIKQEDTNDQTAGMKNDDDDDDDELFRPISLNDVNQTETKLRNSVHECDDMKHILRSIARWDSARVMKTEEDDDMKPYLPTLDISAALNLDVDFPTSNSSNNSCSNATSMECINNNHNNSLGMMMESTKNVVSETSLNVFDKSSNDIDGSDNTEPLDEEGMDNDTLDFLQEFVYDDSIVS